MNTTSSKATDFLDCLTYSEAIQQSASRHRLLKPSLGKPTQMKKCAKQIHHACQTQAFFQTINHTIALSLQKEKSKSSKEFFDPSRKNDEAQQMLVPFLPQPQPSSHFPLPHCQQSPPPTSPKRLTTTNATRKSSTARTIQPTTQPDPEKKPPYDSKKNPPTDQPTQHKLCKDIRHTAPPNIQPETSIHHIASADGRDGSR